MEIIKNIIFNKLNFIVPTSMCLHNELIKTINDIFLLVNNGDNPKSIKESNFEKLADVTTLNIPLNLWSILMIEKNLLNILILILVLPLFFCLFLLIVFLRNQISTLLLGYFNKYEYKTLNFTLFTKDSWRTLWSYAYDFVPRYQYGKFVFEISNLNFWTEFKFPNPKHTLFFFYNLFINTHKPQFLRYLIYIILVIYALFYKQTNSLPVFLFIYYLSIYLDDRWERKRWTFGFKLHRIISFYQKKNVLTRDNLQENLHLNSWLSFYPIFFSFLLFLLTTCLIFIMYFEFFFSSIQTWNGYFSKTIISFFFSNSDTTFWLNNPIVFDYFIALDGLNIWLIWLTSLLVYLCALFLLDTVKLHNFFSQIGWIFLLEFASFQFFCVPNYLWMYIYFELSLLPIFILIIFWGSNRWKVHAAYQMVLFTFIGSLFLLAGIFLLYIKIRTFNCFDIFYVTQSSELNIIFSNFEKKLIWLLLFIGFAVKTPLYPFHIWLPEAHSEAPTTGSVLLAGVLLKMGTYGFLRFVIPLFPSVLETFKTLVFSMCLCGIILSSLAALAQIDIKKIIAYSSIGHMGLVILGIYSMNIHGLMGASYMMLSHGLVSSALFFSIGILYKIYGTRSIIYYTSIAHFMPRFSMCFFVFSLANMSFPGTAGFPGEILIFAALMADNIFLSLFVGIGSIFGGVYSIWLLTRVLYGQISPKISIYRDVKSTEKKILNFLLLLILFFGIFPFLFLDFFKPMCTFFVSLTNT